MSATVLRTPGQAGFIVRGRAHRWRAPLTAMTSQEIQNRLAALAPWFYEFDLGIHGRTVSSLPPAVAPIHQTRLEMVNRAVDAHFGARLGQIRCLDVGCHEGFYSIAMARKNLREVRGVDVREPSLAKARFVAEVLGLHNLTYDLCSCEDLRVDGSGPYELCLFLGVLYHLESPMVCLRNISRITSELCLIETQVIEEVEGQANGAPANGRTRITAFWRSSTSRRTFTTRTRRWGLRRWPLAHHPTPCGSCSTRRDSHGSSSLPRLRAPTSSMGAASALFVPRTNEAEVVLRGRDLLVVHPRPRPVEAPRGAARARR